jgi:hypothetical protein
LGEHFILSLKIVIRKLNGVGAGHVVTARFGRFVFVVEKVVGTGPCNKHLMFIVVDLEGVDSVGVLEQVLISLGIVLEEGEFENRIEHMVVFCACVVRFVFLDHSLAG